MTSAILALEIACRASRRHGRIERPDGQGETVRSLSDAGLYVAMQDVTATFRCWLTESNEVT